LALLEKGKKLVSLLGKKEGEEWGAEERTRGQGREDQQLVHPQFRGDKRGKEAREDFI